MEILHILLISCVLFANFQEGNCIDCYECNSADDGEDCGENPDGDVLIINGKVTSGCKSCVKTFHAQGTIWSKITRRCGTSTETEDSCSDVLGYGKCVCTTTFCNHGNNVAFSIINLMVLNGMACFLSKFVL
ncbi:uncharacterized protein LOC132714530 [Ruditapes philippinarum]|uniref:uncharacterized protein LOC132714530 n=1 Tax=Ruditapes philippinarum TaxID=129788 RepID=UPI00295AF473|nr:uncharacterized protein LOC132714530 [Ruditapes philippinarum]